MYGGTKEELDSPTKLHRSQTTLTLTAWQQLLDSPTKLHRSQTYCMGQWRVARLIPLRNCTALKPVIDAYLFN